MNKLLPFFLLLILFSCNGNNTTDENTGVQKEEAEKPVILDSLFKVQIAQKEILFDTSYIRNLDKKNLVKLDSEEQLRLFDKLQNNISKNTLRSTYGFITVKYVARLEKKHNLTPI